MIIKKYNTYILPISENMPRDEYEERIAQVINHIKNKEIVVLPTETVYGVVADATDDESCTEIFKIKNRSFQNPLILHCSDIDMALEYCFCNTVKQQKCFFYAEKILRCFSPGPITVIMYANDTTSVVGRAGGNTIALRIPNHVVFRDVIKAYGCPLVAPSANKSSRPSPTNATHAYEEMAGSVGVVVDGGECEIGIESTIVDCTCSTWDVPCIVRLGSITAYDIERNIHSKVILHTQFVKDEKEKVINDISESQCRHYMPLCKVYPFLKGKTGHLIRHLDKNSTFSETKRNIFVSVSVDEKCFGNYKWESIICCASWRELAQQLYTIFFTAEKNTIDAIFIECPPFLEYPALYDRILASSSVKEHIIAK